MPLALELWTCEDRLMLRDPMTGQTREVMPIASVTFIDGSTFPPQQAESEEPKARFVQTLSGPMRVRD
jgi:hypothetical protein